MGVLKDDSLLKGVSGRIGNLIFYNVGDKTYVRGFTKKPFNPQSPDQTLQRNRLVAAQTFFQSVKGCILYEVLNLAAREQKKRSGYHLFLKLNINAFGEGGYVDYSLMTFAQGKLQLPYNFNAGIGEERKVDLSWDTTLGQSTSRETDRLLVAAVFADEPFRVVMLDGVDTVRRGGCAQLCLPEGKQGTVHLYCFFGNRDLQAFSDNRYFCIPF